MEQKRGKRKQRFKKGGTVGSRCGCLKSGQGGAGTPLQTMFVCVKLIEDVKMCEQANIKPL